MSRLTTIAAFDLPAKAEFAKIVLQEAGIDAVIADEGIVAMDWLLATAVGGIKVQVRTEEVDKATAVLNERFGPGGKPDDGAVDEDELERQALEAEVDEGETVEPPKPSTPRLAASGLPVAEPEDGEGSERDEYARRFFFASIFGIVFIPFMFYGMYLFLNAAFAPGPISPQSRKRLWIGASVTGMMMLIWYASIQYAIARDYVFPGL